MYTFSENSEYLAIMPTILMAFKYNFPLKGTLEKWLIPGLWQGISHPGIFYQARKEVLKK